MQPSETTRCEQLPLSGAKHLPYPRDCGAGVIGRADEPAHEDKRSGAPDDLAARDDELADPGRVDVLHLELHGGLAPLDVVVPGGPPEGEIGEGRHHAALKHAAPIVMTLLGKESDLQMTVDTPKPERPDERDEPPSLPLLPALRRDRAERLFLASVSEFR